MAKGESYDDLIFQLGDLARERLVNKPTAPRAMDRVLRAEDALVQRQQEVQDLEAQMNEEDAAYQDFLANAQAEKEESEQIAKQFRKAVDAIQGRVKDLRRKLGQVRGDVRYGEKALKITEKKHGDLEMTNPDPAKLEVSKQNIKKLRLQHMRQQRNSEELEVQFNAVFEVRPGQPGGAGITAHKRVLDLEDEMVARKEDLDTLLAELDETIGAKEEELKAAEEYLDQALFMLGEEVYSQRIPDPALAAFYPRLDKAE
jgi:hypothetical protein